MKYNLIELYMAHYKLRHDKRYINHVKYSELNNLQPYNKDIYFKHYDDDLLNAEKHIQSQSKLTTVETYMFDGLIQDYPTLLTNNREVIYELLEKDSNLYLIVDEIFGNCFIVTYI